MNILFDVEATQPNSAGKYHGGGKYGEIVLNRIIKRKLSVEIFYNSKKWLNPILMEIFKTNGIKMHDCFKCDLNSIIKNNHIDLVYTPLVSTRIFDITCCKVVATIHGLREFELPVDPFRTKYNQEKDYRTRIANFLYYHFPFIKEYRLKHNIRNYELFKHNIDFVTVSYHSAYSIRSFFPDIKFDTSKVFYSPSTISELQEKKVDNGKYFLLVSGNRWEKNNLRALMALDKLFSEGEIYDFKVIVTGASSSHSYKYNFKNPKYFNFVGYVNDKELSNLYRNAYCLVYPSLNEGFGYPPLEAMYNGVPVIASAFASIQEVCRDAVLYVNPMSVYEIKNRINMITTPWIWQEYSDKGIKRYKEIRKKQDIDLDKLIDYIFQF